MANSQNVLFRLRQLVTLDEEGAENALPLCEMCLEDMLCKLRKNADPNDPRIAQAAAALEQAGKAGYYAAEFDIAPTSDGVWILMHDATVDRMTDGVGEVSSFTYDEISELKIDSGNGIENYPDEKIISLEDAIAICRKYSMRPMIEVKGGAPEDMRGLLNTIRMMGINDALIIDFNSDRIKELRRLDPEIELWFLVTKCEGEDFEFAKENDMGIAFHYMNPANYGIIKSAKQEGITLASWTVDYIPFMDILTSLGVNYITTNRILP